MRWSARLAMASLPACAVLVASAVSAQPGAPQVAPPSSGAVCPSIDEDYVLCNGDLMSGNCPDFVVAAGALAELYRSEVAQHPDWEASLDTTIWWGCGSVYLSDIAALLAHIGTPEAKALLESEPYRSLPEPRARTSEPAAAVVVDCADVAPAQRDECAAQELAAAQAAHQRAFEACRSAVAPGLRGELLAGETDWKALEQDQCAGADDEEPEPGLQAYERSLCLAQAVRERTEAMLVAHPECARAR